MTDLSGKHILVANVFFAPFSYGGATVVAEQVARELAQQTGARVSAVSLTQDSSLIPYNIIKSECAGIENYIINLPETRQYAELYDNPQVTQLFAQLLDGLAPDLLHAHCLQDMGAGIFRVTRDRDIPIVLSVHDFWWICDRQFMIRPDQTYCGQNPVRIEACANCVENFSGARTRWTYLHKMAEMVETVTYPSTFARDLSEASGFAPGKGVVWPNGVMQPGPDFFGKQAARRAADPRVSFGFLGGPSQIKGWPLLRRTFSGIGREDFRGHLVEGSLDGSWWKDIKIDALKGDWSIHPRFSQDAMDEFYAKIDVLLFLSQWKETFGLAIREALARGIHVIQTDSGGTTEHPRADEAPMIPIGAGPSALLPHVEAALSMDFAAVEPVPVAGFSEQARAFAELIAATLGR